MTLPPFEPVFPTAVVIGLSAIVAVLALIRAFSGRPMRPAWLQAPALLLRFAAIAMVAIFLLNPSEPINVKAPKSRSLVLVDESASMSLGEPTRWEEAEKWVGEFRTAMIDAGLEPPTVAVFASGVEPVKDLEGSKPSGVETNLASAIERMIVTAGATPPDHILVVSDGRAHDRQALAGALAQARARGTGISTLAIGKDTPPRNAGIAAVSAPRVVRANTRVNVRVELSAGGYMPGDLLPLALKDESGARITGSDLRVPAAGSPPAECVLSFDSGVRTTRYTLELAADSRDVAPDDNRFEFTVEVASSKLRVLFVEGTHVKRSVGTSGYWWNDMELMTRAWDATGEIEYTCLTPVSEYLNSPNLVGVSFANGEMIPDKSKDFPKLREELYRYDVMLISDVPVGNFSTDQMTWVVDWVIERGGGFLMGGGYTTFDVGHYDQTPWERITPVDILGFGDGFNEERFKVEIPKAVRKHPTWRISSDPELNEQILDKHPDYTGMNRVRRAKPGALVLMTRPDMDNEPVIAAQQYGRGRSIAYLGDPNGGWAKYLVSWGPPGGPPQGPHTELGHGERFKVNVAATKAASGPPPPHPSPWYGQYWVNVVKWLGENSVRWRRDKLAGNVTVTQAEPGRDLPVAAEVLAVTSLDAVLALNVGARIDRPGSPRVRLEYDRDLREFTGKVPVPADFTGGEVTVLFDTVAGTESLTDAVRVGVRRANREYSESAPDRAFLAELAQVGGGRVVGSVADAVTVCREAATTRARESHRNWSQPLWTRWPWWFTLAAILCLEWALRRRATTNAILATALILFVAPGAEGEEGLLPEAEVKALIEQLGAPRVRLRDEAEAKLKNHMEALEAVKAAAMNGPTAEQRLRARNLAQVIQQNLWQMELVGEGHVMPKTTLRKVIATPDGKRFFTRGEDYVCSWDAETCKPTITFGAQTTMWLDWQRGGPLWTLALSPDSKRIACTNGTGSVMIHNSEDGTEVLRFENMDPSSGLGGSINNRVLWNAAFFPDGRQLATTDRGGWLRIWNTENGDLVKSIPLILSQVVRSLAVSADGKLVACSIDQGGQPSRLWVWNMERSDWTHKEMIANRHFSLAFSRDGGLLLGADNGGRISLWKVAPDGALAAARSFGPVGNNTNCAVFSADEKSIFAVGYSPQGQLSQWDTATGEELWRCPHLDSGGLESVAILGQNRIVTLGTDAHVRIWQRRVVPGLK